MKRRVESIEFVNETTIRRHVSVDFRIRSWMPGSAALRWGDEQVFYMPLALLKKAPLTRFDMRDEAGRAVPLLTRRKNSAIAAAAMSAFAQNRVFSGVAGANRFQAARWVECDATPIHIRVPRELEDDFHRISYLPFASSNEHSAADAALKSFLATSGGHARPPANWSWTFDGRLWIADAEPSEWRIQLASDANFRKLASDFARLFMVTVPVKAQRRERRIMKYTYDEPRQEPQTRLRGRLKRSGDPRWPERFVNRCEDFLEGLPGEPLERDCEWLRTSHKTDEAPRTVSFTKRLMQTLSLHSHVIHVETGGVAHSGSYHLEVEAPAGTQIRRARLSARRDGAEVQRHAERGARSLQRTHLFVGDVPLGATGDAIVAIKPRSTSVIRGASLAAMLGGLLLTAAGLDLATLTDPNSQLTGPTAAVLLLSVSFVVALATRANEHPMTTSMLFGVRCLAFTAALGSVAGASLLIGAREADWLGPVWWLLTAAEFACAAVLMVAWRLAGRRRPDGTCP